uniref:Aerolysin-like C-terminal domain-containing protein n=2 Tax=Poecilia mexicana TaxID=48701 RepID=A0A3B3Z1C6_9TELE
LKCSLLCGLLLWSVSMIRRVLPSAPFRQKIPVNSTLPEFSNTGKLQWATWEGSPPNGAVSIYNNYAKRIDFICKVGCHSGFYNPSKGPYCHYPDKKKEHRSSSFQVLVNEDKFEILKWKEGSYGSVPQNSVRTCSSEEMYVGKNKYGLGKVDPKDKCFYLPWKGKEYWYMKKYEVLTQMKAEKDLISDVKYDTKKEKIFKEPPKTMQSSTVTNHALRPVTKTVSLTKTTTEERRWDISSSVTFSLKTTIKAGFPKIAEGEVEIGVETTHTFSGGNTWTEEISHSVSLVLTVPPNHSCTVKMVGYQYNMDIPFTARLKRTYEDGETRSVIISGSYYGVQVGDIGAEVERCKPLSDSKHFPEMM